MQVLQLLHEVLLFGGEAPTQHLELLRDVGFVPGGLVRQLLYLTQVRLLVVLVDRLGLLAALDQLRELFADVRDGFLDALHRVPLVGPYVNLHLTCNGALRTYILQTLEAVVGDLLIGVLLAHPHPLRIARRPRLGEILQQVHRVGFLVVPLRGHWVQVVFLLGGQLGLAAGVV